MIGALFGWLGANLAFGLTLLRPAPVAEPVQATWCPICGQRLGCTPHIHDQDAIWPTEEPGVVLLTDLTGGRLMVVPTEGPA